MNIHLHRLIERTDDKGNKIYNFGEDKRVLIQHCYDSELQYYQYFGIRFRAIRVEPDSIILINSIGEDDSRIYTDKYKYDIDIYNLENIVKITFNINPDDIGPSAEKCFKKMKEGDFSI